MMMLVFAAAMAEDMRRQRKTPAGGEPQLAGSEQSFAAVLPASAPLPAIGAPRRSVESWSARYSAKSPGQNINKMSSRSSGESSPNLPRFVPEVESPSKVPPPPAVDDTPADDADI